MKTPHGSASEKHYELVKRAKKEMDKNDLQLIGEDIPTIPGERVRPDLTYKKNDIIVFIECGSCGPEQGIKLYIPPKENRQFKALSK